MATTLTIDPITRVEGHSQIDIFLDDGDKVKEARFAVKSFRGFEVFLEGVPIEFLPRYTARVCGICYTAHSLASCKALEAALGIEVSPAARKLREFLHLGNYIESHPLHLGALALPDFVSGDGKPEQRHLGQLLKAHEDLLRRVMKLRQAGSLITKAVGRRVVHPVAAVIGGVLQPPQAEDLVKIHKHLDGAEATLRELRDIIVPALQRDAALLNLGAITTSSLALKGARGVEIYDGPVVIQDERGGAVVEFSADKYLDYVQEEERDFSYMKFPVLKDNRPFRVGPAARLNVNKTYTTPKAAAMAAELIAAFGYPLQPSMVLHAVRIAETMYAVEKAEELMADGDIVSDKVKPGTYHGRDGVGVGIVEAPRGVLAHIYEINKEGFATKVSLYVATQHNNFAINDAVTRAASALITNAAPSETALNRIEMVVRAYDPCLSCATHTVNGRALAINLYGADGRLRGRW
jgi:F420-non-reducing hydrogenase large subunit